MTMKKILVLTLFMSWNAWGDLEVRCINGQQQKVDTRTGMPFGPPLGSVCSSQKIGNGGSAYEDQCRNGKKVRVDTRYNTVVSSYEGSSCGQGLNTYQPSPTSLAPRKNLTFEQRIDLVNTTCGQGAQGTIEGGRVTTCNGKPVSASESTTDETKTLKVVHTAQTYAQDDLENLKKEGASPSEIKKQEKEISQLVSHEKTVKAELAVKNEKHNKDLAIEPIAMTKTQDSNIRVINGKEVDCGLRQNSGACLAPSKLASEEQPVAAKRSRNTDDAFADMAVAGTAVQSPSTQSKQRFTAAEIKERQRRVEAGLPPSDSAVEVKDNHVPVATQQKTPAPASATGASKSLSFSEPHDAAVAGTAVQSPSTQSKQRFTAAEIKERQRRVDAGLPPSDSAVEVKDNHVPVATQQKTPAPAPAPASTTGASKSLSFREPNDAAVVATPAAKPATFSESLKQAKTAGGGVPSYTDQMISSHLNGQANKDLGTVPSVPLVAAKSSPTVDLSNSAKNTDGTLRALASGKPAVKVSAPTVSKEMKTLKDNFSSLDKTEKTIKTDIGTAEKAHENAAATAAQQKTKFDDIMKKTNGGYTKEASLAGVELRKAQEAEKKASVKLAEEKNHLEGVKTERKFLEEEKKKIAKKEKPKKSTKETEARTVSNEEFVMQAAGDCPTGDAECAKQKAEEAKQPVAVAVVPEKPACDHGVQDDGQTCKTEPTATTTVKPTCTEEEKNKNHGTCPDKVADAGKKPPCDKDNKPDGCEPAKPDAKPKIAGGIPDEETYCLCSQYDPQTKCGAGPAQPETRQERKARRAAAAGGNASAKDWAGSTPFKKCAGTTNGKIVDFSTFKMQKQWQEVLCAISDNKDMTGADFHDEIAEYRECAMAFYILKQAQRDSKNPEHLQPILGAGTGDAYKCQSAGLETIDYEDCLAFSEHVTAAEIAKKVATEVQGAKYAMDMQDEQLKASKSPDQATASLTSQKTSVELQQKMMNQQALVDGATVALLASDKANMPNFETLQTWCQGIQNSPLSGNDLGINTTNCTNMIGTPNFYFFHNQKVQDAMTKKIWEIGAATAIDLLKANMLGKQANQIGNAIATIKGITPTPPTGPTMADMQAQLCQLAPTDPGCVGGPGLSRTFGDAGANDSINFGAGGQGTIYSPTELNPNTAAGGGGGSALPTTLAKGSFGANTTAAHNPGGLRDAAAAAQFDNKGGAASGGGGGGGAASGGGGGGSGGGPAGGGAGGGVQSALAGKAPGYGGGGGFSMMGGFGIKNGGKTADTGNPFGKMFDKGPKGDMNFRAPASSVGNKNDNIFEMITKRYNNVSTDKRLMEYEQAK